MRLINRPITEEYSFSDIYRKERLYQPQKQGIRMFFTGTRNPWVQFRHYYSPKNFYNSKRKRKLNKITKRFIAKYLGKSFSEAFSYYCKRYKDKEIFLSYFEGHYPIFRIDSKNLIRLCENRF